jgi:hypothetical protein
MIKIAFPVFRIFRYLYFCSNDFLLSGVRLKRLLPPDITKCIDWMIKHGYLEIEYSGRLPVIVFSQKGWEIERETYAEELFQKMQHLLDTGDYSFVAELKDRNRGMILLLIKKIKDTNNPQFIPLLRAWQFTEYKKVQAELQQAIHSLERK